MKNIKENYQRISEADRSFDINFWQDQGDQTIFEAASEMICDYILIRGGDVNELRIQRSVESFQKV